MSKLLVTGLISTMCFYNGEAEHVQLQTQAAGVSSERRTQRPDVRPKEFTKKKKRTSASSSQHTLQAQHEVSENANSTHGFATREEEHNSGLPQASTGTANGSGSATQISSLRHMEHKHLLESVEIDPSLMASSSVQAVQVNLKEYATSKVSELILTALRIFIVCYNIRTPKAKDLLECMIDADFDVDNIIEQFIVFCDSYGGIGGIPYFKGRRRNNTSCAVDPIEQHTQLVAQNVNETVAAEGLSLPVISANNLDSNQTFVSTTENAYRDDQAQNDVVTPTPQNNSDEFIFEARNQSENQRNNDRNDSAIFQQNNTTEPSTTSLEDITPNIPQEQDTRTERKEKLMRLLKREQKYLKERTLCMVCKTKNVQVTFLPCSHLVTCSDCSNSCFTCPLCDGNILADATTFMV